MNYYQSRKKINEDTWHWTRQNDGVVNISKPCTDECKHSTQEEADKHYYNYLIENAKTIKSQNLQQRCQVCKNFTQNRIELPRRFFELILCDNCNNKDNLVTIYPFHTPTFFASSI